MEVACITSRGNWEVVWLGGKTPYMCSRDSSKIWFLDSQDIIMHGVNYLLFAKGILGFHHCKVTGLKGLRD